MKYKLMIKQHNITKLKYLCITSKENWERYRGSGLYWLKHLEKHGCDFSTRLIFESDDYDIFVDMCDLVSSELNVVESNDYANLIHETGYKHHNRNPHLWWNDLSDERKAEIKVKRRLGLMRYYETTGGHHITKEWKDKLRHKLRHFYTSVEGEIAKKNASVLIRNRSSSDRLKYEENRIESMVKFYSNKESEKYKKWYNGVCNAIKSRYENFSDDDWIKYGEKMSNLRKNLSVEKKEQRKKKIQAVYETGKHDELYKRMSIERFGEGNPNAKIIVWFGERILKGEFDKLCIKNKWSKEYIEYVFENEESCYREYVEVEKEYDDCVCPHCGKSSNGKKPSSFKRWHFDNCKMKVV